MFKVAPEGRNVGRGHIDSEMTKYDDWDLEFVIWNLNGIFAQNLKKASS